ncbi:L-aspartate oxidase [Serinicoccus kebangsaanensis]|uniref:L-aspartate oxidase n=1 Tax=Serinicoccus kebangsaanensis TaxID=2602069 RepID=UPI00124C0715|nr:L-aspartate oxidase [Serinicoccus kebangsaanensis]
MTRVPVVVGAGLAGLTTALHLAPEPCVVLCAGRLGSGAASGWAQGGIAAAVDPDDSAAQHLGDTLAAGAGLCDAEVVRSVVEAAPGAVAWLDGLGVAFDREPDGSYALGLEGAHGRRRIVHVGGDGSGAEIMRAVVAAVRATPSITVVEQARARRLVLGADGEVRGVEVEVGPDRELSVLESPTVVLATGGTGALWQHTTNPRGATGSGLALAARAGAVLRDLEMVQFHPTALDVGRDPMPLVSEAVRGEGAVLVDGSGRRLLDASAGGAGDLAARDVVARAVASELRRGGRVGLDARSAPGARLASHFPAVWEACRRAGVDPGSVAIPVRPAAHYHCGGVLVDPAGRTTVPGLWAVGEVASTGLHGANRLASNSLLEAVVCGARVAAGVRQVDRGSAAPRAAEPPHRGGRRHTAPGPPPWVRPTMTEQVGIARDGAGLAAAVERLAVEVDRHGVDGVSDPVLVALLVARSAQLRAESRGGHLRLDHPGPVGPVRHTLLTLADVVSAPVPARRSA